MGQPTPPGDSPLFEGLGVEWNDIVGALPEDRRAELAPRIKDRLDQFTPLKQWEDFQRSGITPEHAKMALDVFSMVENDPRKVYETIGRELKITPAQAEKVVEELDKNIPNSTPDSDRLKIIEDQLNTLAQIQLAQRQQSTQEQMVQEQNNLIDQQLNELKSKHGADAVNEREILMRMLHENMTPEDAFKDYTAMVTEIRTKRPAPALLGSGGAIPSRAIDPATLDNAKTKSLVAQMLEHAQAENKR